MNENRFSPGAEDALRLAQEAAGELGHGYVGTEHLLLGLMRQEEGLAHGVLAGEGLTEKALFAAIRRSVGAGLPGSDPNQGLTPRAKRVVELAVEDAGRFGERCVGTEHLLAGILRQSNNMALRVLRSAGVDARHLYTALLQKQSDGSRGRVTREKPPVREEGKALRECSRDLTAEARAGRLDPVIGREREISRVIQILSRRSKNNPCLLGEPGVGKTAVAEGLARKIAAGDVPEELLDQRILSLDIAGMVAGTKYRGEFEERIRKVLEEVKRAGNIILFLDELHTVVGAGSAEGAVDAANILKPALGRGELRLIGATTLTEYRRYIEKDAALERRFQPVTVSEPDGGAALEILRGLRERYERHHGLNITEEALEAAVRLSQRYLPDRFLPDKAIDLMDEAASRVRMEGELPSEELKALEEKITSAVRDKDEAIAKQDYEGAAKLRDIERSFRAQAEAERESRRTRTHHRRSVTAEDVAAVVSTWTGVPVTHLTQSEGEKLLHMEEILHRRVVGQEAAVRALARAVRRGRVGLKDPRRPIGSFLFLGPTGVGKTELCKALAEVLFGDEGALLRFDMSEYMERHTVSRLIGSPPGYVGHEEGGQLTEKVRRRPYSVVLFDEMEKAHQDVWNVLLQILDDGRISDAQGRQVDFRNTVIVMTSNVGAKRLTSPGTKLGFTTAGESENRREEAVMAELRETFRPEFLNRVDETILFHALGEGEIREIARRMLLDLSGRMAVMGIALETEESALEVLARAGFDPKYGARPLRRSLRTLVEDPVAEEVLSGRLRAGDTAVLTTEEGRIVIKAPLSHVT